MNTLIVYGTKYGCTEKCAKMLSKKLMGNVDLCNIKQGEIPDCTKYETVIIGGSIYMGKIQKEIKAFYNKNLEVLKNKKLGLFICCMQNGEVAKDELNSSYPEELLAVAAAKEYFGGELTFKKMKMMDRFITNMVSKSAEANFPTLDENKNASIISEETIEQFANVMNHVS